MTYTQFSSPGPHQRSSIRSNAGPLIIAIALVAVNLRMTITAVGPLLSEIGQSQGVSAAMLGLLSALPLAFWGLLAPAAHWLSVRLGMSTAVAWALAVFAVGTLWRSLPGMPQNLWVGTALIGCGLAVINVLMPAIIKRDFSAHVPLVMGLYSALLGGMGALAAGVAVPLSQIAHFNADLDGWRFALLALGFPIPIALTVWLIVYRGEIITQRSVATPAHAIGGHDSAVPAAIGRRVWRDRVAWQVSMYMGAESAVFYSLSGWLAAFQISSGVPAAIAGSQLMLFHVFGIGGSLLMPLLTRRARMLRWMPAILPAVGLIVWVCIPVAPGGMIVWVVVGGLVGGASFTTSLTLMAMRARRADHASALSGMAQSIGYIVAAVGPFFFGVLLQATGGWFAPFAIVWVAAVAQLAIGVSVGRPRYILEGAADS